MGTTHRVTVGDYELLRTRDGSMVRMSKGGESYEEPREAFTLLRDGRIVASGSVNSCFFGSERYGSGQGLAATDEQIVDAVTNDEPVF